MRRQSMVFIGVALLVAVGLMFLMNSLWRQEKSATVSEERAIREEPKPNHEIRFTYVMAGRASKAGSVQVSFGRYKSEDGHMAERRVESHKSAEEAKAEMLRMIRAALRIVERCQTFDEQGEVTRERVVLLARVRTSEQPEVFIVWTQGPKLHVLQSDSLPHVLSLERQLYSSSH